MPFDFSRRRVVVAGGSRGIGRAIALAFARSGAAVSVCARGEQALQDTHQALAACGGATHTALCDLADGAAVARYIEQAAAALGGIDVLVNNASGFGMGDDEAAWAAGMAVDVMAVVRASQAALPYLLRNASSNCIINISSISGHKPSTRAPAYAAVKAALNHYTGSQAAMYARQGLRVNGIAPGSVEFAGGTWEQRREAGDPLYAQVHKSIPFGRLGTPDEIAEVALFLASPHARWVTGQVVVVDGGQLLGV
jgi:3-oxoacyl-[acyl-carrier protein] reductase